MFDKGLLLVETLAWGLKTAGSLSSKPSVLSKCTECDSSVWSHWASSQSCWLCRSYSLHFEWLCPSWRHSQKVLLSIDSLSQLIVSSCTIAFLRPFSKRQTKESYDHCGWIMVWHSFVDPRCTRLHMPAPSLLSWIEFLKHEVFVFAMSHLQNLWAKKAWWFWKVKDHGRPSSRWSKGIASSTSAESHPSTFLGGYKTHVYPWPSVVCARCRQNGEVYCLVG